MQSASAASGFAVSEDWRVLESAPPASQPSAISPVPNAARTRDHFRSCMGGPPWFPVEKGSPAGTPQGFLPCEVVRKLLLGRELDDLPALLQVVGAGGAAVEEALGLVHRHEAKPEVQLVAEARDVLGHRGRARRVQPPQVTSTLEREVRAESSVRDRLPDRAQI